MGQHMIDSIQLKSPAFRDNAEIPERYTCDGENINPPLQLFSPNPDVQTFALILDDPDAPGGTFTHWLLWNIDTNTTEIEEGVVPVTAVQGTNSEGRIGYTGPCPPQSDPSTTLVRAQGTNTAGVFNYAGGSSLGEHRYRFKLFALDTHLALSERTTQAELEEALQGHILEQTTLTGRFERSKPKGESKKRRLQ